jgi:CAAX protease family protein
MQTEPNVLGLRQLFWGPAHYVPQSPWGPVRALVVTAIACLVPVLVFFLGLSVAILLDGASPEETVAALGSLATPSGVGLVAVSQAVSFGVIWLAAGRNGKRREVLRFLDPKPGWGLAAAAAFLVIAATTTLELLLYFAIGFDIFADAKWLLEGLRGPYWWAVVLVAVVLAPLWEEAAFRGFLLSALASTRLGFWPAAVVSSGLWTLLHWGYSYFGLASVFLAGLCLSWIMWRWGSLRAVVVAHAIANAVAISFATLFAPAG